MMIGSCVDMDAMLIASTLINVISDFAILILPIYSVWHLQALRKQKWGLTAVFIVGIM